MNEGDSCPKGTRYAWRFLANAAMRMGVNLKQTEVDRFYHYNYLGVVVDRLVDDKKLSDDEREKLIREILLDGNIQSVGDTTDRDLLVASLDYVASLPEQVRDESVSDALDAMSSEPLKREATTLDDLIGVRMKEAYYYTTMMRLDDSGHNPDSAHRVRFNHWLRTIAEVGYLVDTLIDLDDDSASGEIGLTPKIRHKVILARQSFVGLIKLARLTPVGSYSDVIYYLRKYNHHD